MKEREKFSQFEGWQGWCGTFTYSVRPTDSIINYIKSQRQCHKLGRFMMSTTVIENGIDFIMAVLKFFEFMEKIRFHRAHFIAERLTFNPSRGLPPCVVQPPSCTRGYSYSSPPGFVQYYSQVSINFHFRLTDQVRILTCKKLHRLQVIY